MEKIETKKTITIIISGRAGVGKTTLANMLAEYITTRYTGLTVKKSSIAHRVKACARFMGWDGEKDLNGRKLLQGLGQVGRDYDINCWIRTEIEGIENLPKYPYDVLIIDDWRFMNELDYLDTQPLYDVFTVRVDSPERESLKNTPEYSDESETSLNLGSLRYGYTLFNTGPMDNLSDQMKHLWDTVLERKEESIIWKQI